MSNTLLKKWHGVGPKKTFAADFENDLLFRERQGEGLRVQSLRGYFSPDFDPLPANQGMFFLL